MGDDQSVSLSWPILAFACTEIGFITVFALVAVSTPKEAMSTRVGGLFVLVAATFTMEGLITPLCLENERPHWAAILTALLWVQFLNASDLLLLLGIDACQWVNSLSTMGVGSAVGILFNSRRVGTPWQINNLPSTADIRTQSPSSFLLRRLTVTAASYLFLDIMVSLPPPDPVMVLNDKVALSLRGLSVDDVIFRIGATMAFWFTSAVVVIATNNLFAIIAVLLGLSQPEDCPPAFGPFLEAYNMRRFWG